MSLEDELHHTPGAKITLSYTIAMASNLIPLFTIKSTTPAASTKVGILQPIPWTEREKLEVRERDHWALDFSPATTMGESVELPLPPVLMERRVAFETGGWMQLQRPLSEEITMKSLCFGAPSGIAF